jgi:ribonuclease R
MDPRREAILALFVRGRPLSAREIAGRMDLTKPEVRSLQRTLRSLCQGGVLRRLRDGRYALQVASEVLEGVVSFRSSGLAELTPEIGDAVRVPAPMLAGALPGDRVRAQLLPARGGLRRAARVLEILEEGPRQLLGTFRRAGRGGYVEPREPELFPYHIAVPREALGGAEDGNLVLAQLTSPLSGGARVTGRVARVLGHESDPGVEVTAIAFHHGLRLEFPEDVMTAVDHVPQSVTPPEQRGRLDLRRVPFVTIDGEDARDFDDAVAVERLSGDGYLLRVAVADVSHYVAEGTALDREAQRRGTSVYFPGRVLPMLPPELSNGICSLNPEVDRLALCAELHFARDGAIRKEQFQEVVFRSHARLTYDEVSADLQAGRPLRGAGDPTPMVDLCELLSRRRRERGSLDFDIPEAKVLLDEDGEVRDVVRRERHLAHRMVEEFMIAANEAVARFFEIRGQPTVYRVHDRPDPEKTRAFCELAGALGFHLRPQDADEPRALARFVESLGARPEARALNTLLLRSMKQAFYDVENIGHFGLASGEYLHFTSPIRRYPDLLVHRLLRTLLRDRGPAPGSAREGLSAQLSDLAAQASARERAALEAERESLAYHRARLMAGRVGGELDGVVAAVVPFGLFVEVERPFVEGLVHVQTLGDGFYTYDEQRQRLSASPSGRGFGIGDRVRVRVVDASVARRQVNFALVREVTPRPASASPPPPPPTSRPGRARGPAKRPRGGKGARRGARR